MSNTNDNHINNICTQMEKTKSWLRLAPCVHTSVRSRCAKPCAKSYEVLCTSPAHFGRALTVHDILDSHSFVLVAGLQLTCPCTFQWHSSLSPAGRQESRTRISPRCRLDLRSMGSKA